MTLDLQRVRNSVANDHSRFGLLPEEFQQAGPAAVDVLAHLLARFGAHLLELAMLKLHARRVGAVGNEPAPRPRN